MREIPSAAPGNPLLDGRHVVPPSVDLYRPLPAISIDAPLRTSHGATRAAHNAAYNTCGFAGSITSSAAPVFSSLYKTFSKLFPPSVDRNTPRSAFGPYGCPSAATYTLSASFGSTTIAVICCASRSPKCVQVFPASLDLYIPSPTAKSGRCNPSPLPT